MKVLPLAALLVAGSAAAAQTDYLINATSGGFDVHEVVHNTLTTIPGGPFNPTTYPYGNFSSLGVQAAASDGTYLYAIYRADAPVPEAAGYAAMIYTFKVESDVPKQVSYLRPTDMFGSSGCGRCGPHLVYMSATPQHVFVINNATGFPNATVNALSVYHATDGVLTEECVVTVGTATVAGSDDTVTSVTTDSGEIYAYVNYTNSETGPYTAVFDISTKACKAIGTITD